MWLSSNPAKLSWGKCLKFSEAARSSLKQSDRKDLGSSEAFLAFTRSPYTSVVALIGSFLMETSSRAIATWGKF